MEVSDLEKKKVIRNVIRGQKKNHFPRNLSAAVAILVCSSIALGIANPTFAAKLPIVGSIFELFNNDETYVFEDFDKHATEIGITKESNGISVTVTDAVYDGENITIAYTMESEMDLGDSPVLEGKLDAEEFQDRYKDYGYFPKHSTKKISDNEYAGLFIFQLIDGPKPDVVHVTWDGDNVFNLANTEMAFYLIGQVAGAVLGSYGCIFSRINFNICLCFGYYHRDRKKRECSICRSRNWIHTRTYSFIRDSTYRNFCKSSA